MLKKGRWLEFGGTDGPAGASTRAKNRQSTVLLSTLYYAFLTGQPLLRIDSKAKTSANHDQVKANKKLFYKNYVTNYKGL